MTTFFFISRLSTTSCPSNVTGFLFGCFVFYLSERQRELPSAGLLPKYTQGPPLEVKPGARNSMQDTHVGSRSTSTWAIISRKVIGIQIWDRAQALGTIWDASVLLLAKCSPQLFYFNLYHQLLFKGIKFLNIGKTTKKLHYQKATASLSAMTVNQSTAVVAGSELQ